MANPFNDIVTEEFGQLIWTPTAIGPSALYSISTGLMRGGGREIGFRGLMVSTGFATELKALQNMWNERKQLVLIAKQDTWDP